ncbi:conserved hypothetical protein [Paraburkholderia piptadeniae]|uniref:Transposase n=1 Tax=Paraburkholderia piptadeniae TaxID=1701573 RepID=A0A1N7RST6_9BURK|nr:hypothetical protein [Paraburkholderia piptadeniae]SIT38159.1 conserved hypothetical protein [Paraburkholderia piptadeniae]
MQSEKYRDYVLWGHAILEQVDTFERQQYAASGTVTRGGKLVEASGILGLASSGEEAQLIGLEWARAWVDSHG